MRARWFRIFEEIRSITFTVPADTPAGTYQIHGGYVDLLITVGFMDSYPKEFLRQIADATITVIPADAAEPDGHEYAGHAVAASVRSIQSERGERKQGAV